MPYKLIQDTLKTGEVLYLEFYLQEKDPTSGSITGYDLSSSSSIVFSMREYNSTINTLTLTMSTVTSPSCTIGFCKVLATIPAVNEYYSQICVYMPLEKLVWNGPVYKVEKRL